MQLAKNKERMALVVGCGIALALILFAAVMKYAGNATTMNTVYEKVLEKKKVLAQMRIHLLQSVDMEKSAVMALGDQESLAYAEQSRAASTAVSQDLASYRQLVASLPMPNEQKLLDEFATCWTELGKLDQVILHLAVENTNLKAIALSREQGTNAIQRLEQAVDAVRAAAAGEASESRVDGLTARIVIATLKVFNLHGPHILEADNGGMDQLEAAMNAQEAVATQALTTLGEIFGGTHPDAVAQVKAAVADFATVTAEVVRLSRHNSNIKSLELSMGRKRSVAAQCDEALAALQEAVQNKTFKATK